ncbi:MAG: lactate racemase domain-containing protein [Candidatus Sifarchaeia archaeon]
MDVHVTYGDGTLNLKIPNKNLAGYIEPKSAKTSADVQSGIERVLDNPHGPLLSDISKSKSVCVLVEDHTRDAPHWDMISAVVPRLTDANRVQFIITTGSHEVNHPENLKIVDMIKRAAADAKLARYDVIIHDCQSEDMIDLGKTSRGTPVIVNASAVGHDVYVSLSDMKAHYFAGYSNFVKNFLPGVCAFKTIEANHALALDPRSTFGVHPFHPDESRRDNPLADDMGEAMRIITRESKVFLVAIVSSNRKLVWADAGSPEPVTARGMELLDETSSFTVIPRTRIIVSPGGYPQDKSLYHAQRAIELTKNAVIDGGEILCLAECRDGVAPTSAIENFYNKLSAPLDDVIKSISGKYHLYEHKAYKFAELLKRVSRVWLYSKLNKETVETAHLEFVEDPQAVIDEWIREEPNVKILVLDKGNKIAVYAR